MEVRGFYPNVFSNEDAHSLVLSDPYESAEKVLAQLLDKIETVAPLQVSSNQLYRWMLVEEEDAPIVFDVEKDLKSSVFALWKDGIMAIKDKDLMWRTAMDRVFHLQIKYYRCKHRLQVLPRNSRDP